VRSDLPTATVIPVITNITTLLLPMDRSTLVSAIFVLAVGAVSYRLLKPSKDVTKSPKGPVVVSELWIHPIKVRASALLVLENSEMQSGLQGY
jgi:hypothetical protein